MNNEYPINLVRDLLHAKSGYSSAVFLPTFQNSTQGLSKIASSC